MHHEQGLTHRPRIVASDRDAATVPLLADELHARYGRHYDVVAASNEEAHTYLGDVTQSDVALVVADRADDGAALLAATRTLHPRAKRVLLIGWNEHRSEREEIVAAITPGDVDYYVAKPTAPPDEHFHRAISELDDWWRHRGRSFAAIRVVVDDHFPRTLI
jgi:thioredoxin reductase (NADPH)